MLDIQHDAKRLADAINGITVQGRRKIASGNRLIVRIAGQPVLYGVDTTTARTIMSSRSKHIVGVYTPGVTPEQIAADLEATP